MKPIILFFSLFLLFSTSTGCSRTVPLVNPSFHVESSNLSKTADAIKTALRGRDWMLVREFPNRMIARYEKGRGSGASIQIDYSRSTVSIKLVESSELHHGYDKHGREVIHKNYQRWIDYLEKDIRLNLGYNR